MIRDEVLINEWFPVYWAKDLKDDPVSVELLEEKVVLFRSEHGVHAFKDLCVHRGAALSLGRVEGDRLVCPYHGWTYDCQSGRCVRIPAQDSKQQIPPRARAQVYSCQEQYGLIWVCLGTPKHPIPAYPEYDAPGWRSVQCGPYLFNASAPRVMENLLDIAHIMWVHDGLIGDSRYPEIKDYQVEIKDWGFRAETIEVFQPDPDGLGHEKINSFDYQVVGPFSLYLVKTDNKTNEVISIIFFVTPITEHRTVEFIIRTRNYALNLPDAIFSGLQDAVVAQDVPIVEHQRPEKLPLDLAAEMHLKSDRLAVEYRRWLKHLGVSFGTA